MNRGVKILFLLLAAFLVLGCELETLYLNAYIEANQEALDTPMGTDETPITFTVAPGQSIAEIAGNLKAKRLIADTELFRRYVQAKGIDQSIQAGTYELSQAMTLPQIARALESGATAEQQVAIPEGKRIEEVAELVAEQTTIAAADFLALVQTGWSSTTLVANHDFLAQVPLTATLEGFLFPDTYRVPFGATAQDVVDRMLQNFGAKVTPELRQAFSTQGLSLYEGITLAAIVEREAVLDVERPVIAGVFYNRLRDGWPLSTDPTVQYALGYRPDEGSWWKRFLTFDDLEVASPYNTYRNLGLPPGPIASPGLSAIAAAAQPAETQFYFFMVDCAKQDGSHVFAATNDEHLANYARCGGVVPEP
ncbi:MAG: endolytic transglycosylase MltG [Anaerolineae bacterium]|jgi:UPF0755 protein|nr:endolytic transglycosylase MltG [Anaerolineae bacterium]